jgi:hypothetical protein
LEFGFLGSDFGATVLGVLQLSGEGASFSVIFIEKMEEKSQAKSTKNQAQCDRHNGLLSKPPKKFLQMQKFPQKKLDID